jgi:hypothetical protein
MTTVTEERTQRRDEFALLVAKVLTETPEMDVKRNGNWITVTYRDMTFNLVVSAKRGG